MITRREVLHGLAGMVAGASLGVPTLANATDSPLESAVQRYINKCRRTGIPGYGLKVRDRGLENFSVVVYDIEKGDAEGVAAGKLVKINEDTVRWSASMNKIFALLSYWHQVDLGRIPDENAYTGDSGYLERMIQHSNNAATNRVIGKVGGEKKATAIARHYGLDDTQVALIPSSGRTTRNLTTAHDLNIFLNQLYHRKFPHSEEIITYLGLPNHDRVFDHTCIPRQLDVNGDGKEEIEYFGIVDKTGTMYGLCGNAALLTLTYRDKDGDIRKKPYTVIGIIEDKTVKNAKGAPGYTAWAKSRGEIIRSISEGAYWHMVKEITGKDYKCQTHNGKHLA